MFSLRIAFAFGMLLAAGFQSFATGMLSTTTTPTTPPTARLAFTLGVRLLVIATWFAISQQLIERAEFQQVVIHRFQIIARTWRRIVRRPTGFFARRARRTRVAVLA